MTVEILNENDFLTGATLHVKIPQDDLDKNALYTIQAEKPAFVLPFNYRHVDGQVEFTYQIGTRTRLQYLSGQRSAQEYASFWSDMLSPLRDCGDWFMKPGSFVLSADYLFCEKADKTISYVYIPSIRACSEPGDLKEMAADITKYIIVDDTVLENKVLRAIMKDFEPDSFLQMLKKYVSAVKAPAQPQQGAQLHAGNEQAPAGKDGGAACAVYPAPDPEQQAMNGPAQATSGTSENNPGDIVINIPASAPQKKKTKERKKEDPPYPEKAERQAGFPIAGRLFGNKKEAQRRPKKEKPQAPPEAEVQCVVPAVQDEYTLEGANNGTQSLPDPSNVPGFRLVGNTQLPPRISVYITCGEIYTVGRYDAALGKRQCSFEFENRTKAVSRRHAAIERDANGYSIIDLASSAGTFVNGKMLPPNTPCQLGRGCHVSFGNAGADYIWEG